MFLWHSSVTDSSQVQDRLGRAVGSGCLGHSVKEGQDWLKVVGANTTQNKKTNEGRCCLSCTETLWVCVMWESCGEDLRQMRYHYLSVRGHRAGCSDKRRVSVLRHSLLGKTRGHCVYTEKETQERKRESTSECNLPLKCAFIKTKSSLAPTTLSFGSKTKGNGPHFLLELIMPDLFAGKLRGGRARLQTCSLRVPVLV